MFFFVVVFLTIFLRFLQMGASRSTGSFYFLGDLKSPSPPLSPEHVLVLFEGSVSFIFLCTILGLL